jgi:hypothetical protein
MARRLSLRGVSGKNDLGARTVDWSTGRRVRLSWVVRAGACRTGHATRRGIRRWACLLLAPVTAVATGTALVPVSVVVAGAAAVTAAGVVAGSVPARASSVSVLVLSTSVNGGSSSAEAVAASGLGYTVTVASPATWDAMTTAQFEGVFGAGDRGSE